MQGRLSTWRVHKYIEMAWVTLSMSDAFSVLTETIISCWYDSLHWLFSCLIDFIGVQLLSSAPVLASTAQHSESALWMHPPPPFWAPPPFSSAQCLSYSSPWYLYTMFMSVVWLHSTSRAYVSISIFFDDWTRLKFWNKPYLSWCSFFSVCY